MLGINGVRVLPPSKGNDTVYIYFSNTGASTFHRVPVSLSTLQKLGPVETLFSGFAIDDFALDEERGNAYLAGGERNALLKVALDGGRGANCVWGRVRWSWWCQLVLLWEGRGERKGGVCHDAQRRRGGC